MRGRLLVVVSLLAASSIAAHAQATGERIPLPEPIEGWNPTPTQPPRPADARRQPVQPVDPWHPYIQAPAGITAGEFTFYPSITAGAFYDDNVFATSAGRVSDWAAIVRPELGWRTAGANYSIEGQGFIEGRRYHRYTSEDQVNGSAAVAATVMPNPDTQLIGRLRYVHAHEDRGGGESVLTVFDQPVDHDTFEASGALNRRFGRFWTSLGLAGSWQHYDTPSVAGIPVDQSYRDGNVVVYSGRFGYVVMPLTSVFVEVAGNRRNFQVDNFDSTGYRVVGGLLLEQGPGARVKGEIYAGYMHQDYNFFTFENVSTFTYGGALAWLIAPKWTAVFEGRRQALESALNPTGVFNGGTSVVESLLGVRLDYALLPNLIVGLGATYLVDEFKTAGRTDRTLSPLVSVKYLVNPFVTVGFDYRNVGFDSSGFAVGNYSRNVYLLSINAKI